MIDKATQEKIKETADIVEVVSDYVHLIRSGNNYKGLCPFHNERTPSFSVNKARNFCYCFSCKKGGSPVNFIMQKEGISYNEALRQLAKKYGIKIEEKEISDEERVQLEKREAMYLANEWAMQLFEKNLTDTDDGRDIGLQYLYGRGVTNEAIKAFHLGYALDRSSSFIDEARKRGFNLDLLKELGLIGESRQGFDYDRFRGRVIFPIMSSSNKVVGFGGRSLKQDAAKYVNSPESDIYKKSRELYGMSQARQTIVAQDLCFLVEGYLDVIGMWQSGMKNVVASSGTALTDEQIALIHRFTKNVTLIYDGDAAGIKAALRGMDMLLEHNLNVNLLLLPDGDDPDSFARKHTPEEFRKYVEENQTDVIRFKAKVLMNEASDNPQRKVSAIKSMVETLAHIPDKVKRDVYVQECSRIMNVGADSIISAVADARNAIKYNGRQAREMTRLNKDLASGRIAPQPSKQSPDQSSLPLRPMEWKVIQYCLKYGFMDFCEVFDEEDEVIKKRITVIEFVNDELINDQLQFSVKEYAEVFKILNELFLTFKSDLEIFKQSLTPGIEKKRREGFDIIASKNMSIAEINKEEAKLEEEINRWEENEIEEFSRDYPSRHLASHENDAVRQITNEAIQEPHRLSQIFSRGQQQVESEKDKLFYLLPTAISVWKNGILDLRLKELLNRLKIIGGTGNDEEVNSLQAQLATLIQARSKFAKDIGDRIICPVSPAIK